MPLFSLFRSDKDDESDDEIEHRTSAASHVPGRELGPKPAPEEPGHEPAARGTRVRFKPDSAVGAPEGGLQMEVVTWVQGTVVAARNLPKVSIFSKSAPYCLVKGIRSDGTLLYLDCTPVVRGRSPRWDHSFKYSRPQGLEWADLIGLKFLVYRANRDGARALGSADFLGGADVKFASLRKRATEELLLDLAGTDFCGMTKKPKKNPRMNVVLTFLCASIPEPPPPMERLRPSLAQFQRVDKLVVSIGGAERLPSSPALTCIVRIKTIAGEVIQVHETNAVPSSRSTWDERCEYVCSGDPAEEPCFLAFDVWSNLGGQQARYVGGNVFPLAGVRHDAPELELVLYRHGHRLDMNLDCYGSLEPALGAAFGHVESIRERQASGAYFHRGGRLSRRSVLSVVLDVTLAEEPMPMVDVIDNPLDVEDHGSCEILRDDWIRSNCFFPPPPQMDDFGKIGKSRITASPRVVCAYGVLRGCSGLRPMDRKDATGVYCIVETCTQDGRREFRHRTYVNKDISNPEYGEAFLADMPPHGDEAQLLIFTVYLHRRGASGEPGVMLGEASVDLRYLRNAQELSVELPLVGGRRMEPHDTWFCQPATISVDVFVERRVQPILVPGGAWAFSSHAEAEVYVPSTAETVWDLHFFDKLKGHREERNSWMTAPRRRRREPWYSRREPLQAREAEDEEKEEGEKARQRTADPESLNADMAGQGTGEADSPNADMELAGQTFAKPRYADPTLTWSLPHVPAIVQGKTTMLKVPALPSRRRDDEFEEPPPSIVGGHDLLRYTGPPGFVPDESIEGLRAAAWSLAAKPSAMSLTLLRGT